MSKPRSRSYSPSRSPAPRIHPWETAGSNGKARKELQTRWDQPPRDLPPSSSGKHPAKKESSGFRPFKKESRWDKRTTNPSDRTARDVRKLRESAPYSRSRTVVNGDQDVFVPSYSAPRLDGNLPSSSQTGTNPGPPTHNPAAVVPSYAAMTMKSSGGQSNSATPLTPRDVYHVKIIRKDRGPFTRDDQWAIQAEACDVMEQASVEGKAETVHHSGTRMSFRELQIYCSPTSGNTWKNMATKMGYDAYLPGERKPGHPIWGTIPRVFQSKVGNIGTHIAAGTFGGIKADQVKVLRKPWWNDHSNIYLHLEVDAEAWEWLKRNLWVSSIGLYIIRWQHPPVKGLQGYIAPDADIGVIFQGLDKRRIEQEETEAEAAFVTAEEIQAGKQDIRSRHITGEDKEKDKQEASEDRMLDTTLTEQEAEERVLLEEKLPKELQQHRVEHYNSSDSSDFESKLKGIAEVLSSTPETRSCREKKRSNEPGTETGGSKTLRRMFKETGHAMSHPSDTGEDDDI